MAWTIKSKGGNTLSGTFETVEKLQAYLDGLRRTDMLGEISYFPDGSNSVCRKERRLSEINPTKGYAYTEKTEVVASIVHV